GGVRGQHSRASRDREHGNAAAWSGAAGAQCLQDVEELVRGGRLDDACPGKGGLDGAVEAGQGACVTGGSAGARAVVAGLEHAYGLVASLGCGDEVAALPERLGEEPDHRGGQVQRKPFHGVALGDVHAVPDRQKAGHAKAATASLREEHAAEGAALTDHADAPAVLAYLARWVGKPPEVAAVDPSIPVPADHPHAVRADK